ncbi:hypothetical protein TVAG_197440 [Trichomonas vaginalis G3]|uniref:Uncharacterized protein n=1 Tax=Trichomonas vaginalis (strain ATCC PRA-98 / G3) TaxID=412133 RepID=A2EPL4_TRIV3|nr:EP4 subtype prostaglandin E2 receptor binding [Trichomonas vaginalis G3]EAY05443.1 hypothetical protein TVAG_197440 [Trichomonas vaginalis G3]KAI5523885.1 EP4 subtype prostaglandin E2 receptor binding [Trichomonas vaginalis G3]|eukprot:XP_001317666.1 hypothetical protein [Trichomonas vaginalis G3]
MSDIMNRVYESLQMFDNHSITIYINDHAYDTNLFIGLAISDKLRNDFYLNRSTKEFRFNINISDTNTYKIFEKILKLQIPENIGDKIAIDFLKLGEEMKSKSLMSFFINRYGNDTYTTDDILIKIKYCNYIGYTEKIFDFICDNIDSINHNDLIDSIAEAGLDFAEQLIIHMKNRNLNTNDIIFSLINKNPIFIEIISYLNDDYTEIRYAIDSLKNLSTNEGKSSIISIFKTILDKSKEKDFRIKQLECELTTTKDELTKLRNENAKLKQEPKQEENNKNSSDYDTPSSSSSSDEEKKEEFDSMPVKEHRHKHRKHRKHHSHYKGD